MPLRTISIKKIAKRKAVFLLLISNVFFFAIPLYFLVIGFWEINSCPGSPYLPPWMIIVALLIVIDRLIFWRRLVNETKFEKTFPRPSLIGSVERIKTWEENRVWSSSRTLLGLMAAVRVAIFRTHRKTVEF
ncbi:Protein CBG04879 [Caenorhabditis briggsae]|uniref:Protein CBG04879 n=1 Tax=Caenorhabditis briggsae TaxID=6238 RepID=A8WYP8_CAEBR|nr:Protein CBG04879 [Caenorhabditis briggsae]CAP25506.2 Protein CBG04879 [Caenorhabditis briggsae]